MQLINNKIIICEVEPSLKELNSLILGKNSGLCSSLEELEIKKILNI